MTQGFGRLVFFFPSVLALTGWAWERSAEFQVAKLGAGEGGARCGGSAGEALLAWKGWRRRRESLPYLPGREARAAVLQGRAPAWW